MEVLNLILTIIFLLSSVVLVVLVLMQSGKSAGLTGAITGGAETFFGKKKAHALEAKLERFTKIDVVIFIILALALVILQQ